MVSGFNTSPWDSLRIFSGAASRMVISEKSLNVLLIKGLPLLFEFDV